MKRIRFYLALILTIASLPAYSSGRYNPFQLPPDTFSAAYESGAFSWMLNPVFSVSDSQADIAYRCVSTEEVNSHYSFITLFGFGLGYSYYNSIYDGADGLFHTADTGIFSIGRGFLFGDIFGIGLGYSCNFSAEKGFKDYRGWNAGILFRPAPFISFGLAFRDIAGELEGNDLEVTKIYSVALRPFGDRFTISAERITGSKVNSGDRYYSFSGEIRAWHNMTLSFRADTLENCTAGISVPFDMRISSSMNITPDFYYSHAADDTGLYSAGFALRMNRKEGINIPVTKNMLFIRMDESLVENGRRDFFSEESPELLPLINGIMNSADDPSIDGIVIEIDSVNAGFAQIQEIRRSLKYFRSRGKKVYAMMNASGNKEYYLASCADSIYFPPNSEFSITGLRASVYFIKGFLDKIGVRYESVRRGEYKSFNEPFTRSGMSPEAESNLREILEDLNEQFISAICERRSMTREKVKDIFSTGFYTPDEAKEKGFIDEVMYQQDMIDSLAEHSMFVPLERYNSEKGISSNWGKLPAIAIVYVKGTITDGEGKQDGIAGTTGSRDYSKAMESAFTDSNIKGVVIRIDSGGGSAAASDFMWKSLVHFKKKYPKPVVFSFGNTAASGGYYIACTGDRIFAEKGTITGSIGVITGRISAAELYAKLGISKQTITLSEFADIFDESRPLSDREYQVLDRATGFIYDRFTGKVAEARKMPKGDVEKIAGGRIHSGSGAMKKNLVDEEGGLYAAIQFCRTTCGLKNRFTVIQLPDNSSFMPEFGGGIPGVYNGVIDLFIRSAKLYGRMDGEALYLQPFYIEIE